MVFQNQFLRGVVAFKRCLNIVTDHIQSMAEGTVFIGVCHSFCPWGGGVSGQGVGVWSGWVDVWSGGGGVWSGRVSGRGWVSPWGVWSGGVGVWLGVGTRTPIPEMATAAVGTHPTGMLSCFKFILT